MHQIGEYMNLSRKDIWDAIQNMSNDILDEDEDYRNGRRGDVIVVEDSPSDVETMEERRVKAEEVEVNEMLDNIIVDQKSGRQSYASIGRASYSERNADDSCRWLRFRY